MALSSSGYAGKTLLPREIAEEGRNYWKNYELTKAVAVALGESGGSLGAWHDNYKSDGVTLSSRDCGLYQINIPAGDVGTQVEKDLRSESLDPYEYIPVKQANAYRAWEMYNRNWIRDGKQDIRRWQAWVAYTTGWALFPEFWVWRHVNGVPEGPWVATGRFIQRAICAQMNYHLVITKDWNENQALYYGKRYADHFKVKSNLFIKRPKNSAAVVAFEIPDKPEFPPSDGIGPRPVPNNGV